MDRPPTPVRAEGEGRDGKERRVRREGIRKEIDGLRSEHACGKNTTICTKGTEGGRKGGRKSTKTYVPIPDKKRPASSIS